jgi:hypothetical protein
MPASRRRALSLEQVLGQDLQIVTFDESRAEHIAFDGFVLESRLTYKTYGSYGALLMITGPG